MAICSELHPYEKVFSVEIVESQQYVLDNGRPRIVRLNDLNIGVCRLKTLLEVFTGAKASNQEDSLE